MSISPLAYIDATNYTVLDSTNLTSHDLPPCPTDIPAVPHWPTTLIDDTLKSTSLQPALSQFQTNGNTTIGTLDYPGLPIWVPTYVCWLCSVVHSSLIVA